jgi:pyruvate dehydrogenase E1 component beta subunit
VAETKTYREALREGMVHEMDNDESVVLMGEDIGVYGGTHLITDGLIDEYGPKRVIDTPISELGFTGAAVGMAMMGMKPVVEMMTWNFSFLASDQIIQHAAKVRYFSGGQVEVPLVIRGPNGGGVQLSAQHTHSLENLYGHFPGLKVVSPVTPNDVKGMMITAIRDPNPVIFLEAGALYGTKGEVEEGDNATLEEEDGVSAEVIDVRSIRPFDEETIIQSVEKTHRAVTVQEQWRWFGVASEVAAIIQEGAFDSLDAPVQRVSGAEVPAPYARNLELAAFPSEKQVTNAARRALYIEEK